MSFLSIGRVPDVAAKIISPSKGVWLGSIALAIPVWADVAIRFKSFLLKSKFVQTIPNVVASPVRSLVGLINELFLCITQAVGNAIRAASKKKGDQISCWADIKT